MPKRDISDPAIIWPEGKSPGWKNTEGGMTGGKFGRIEHAVVCSTAGVAVFDRAIVHEGPHVITITWGRDPTTQEPKLGLVKEARDTAAPADGVTSLAFWGPPRGFRDNGETPAEAARREAGEEIGAKVIISTTELGDYIVNETCVGSWSPVVVVETDLALLAAAAPQRGEKIYKAKFFSFAEVMDMIKAREADGAATTSMVLLTTVLLWQTHVLIK